MVWVPILAALAGSAASYGLSKLDKGGGGGSIPEQFKKIRTGTPEAERFQKKIFKQGGMLPYDKTYKKGKNFLTDLLSGSQGAFDRFEEPYMRNFNENIVPDIANRFAGMGTGNSGLSSSGFQQTLANAGKGLQGDLAALRSNLQMQALGPALAYAQQPISNQFQAMDWSPYQTTHQARQPGAYDSLAQLMPSMFQNLGNQYMNYQNQPPGAPSQGGGIGAGGGYNPNLPYGR